MSSLATCAHLNAALWAHVLDKGGGSSRTSERGNCVEDLGGVVMKRDGTGGREGGGHERI